MAERKSLGLLKMKKKENGETGLNSTSAYQMMKDSHDVSDTLFTLDDMKRLIQSLGGDTDWIERIPNREDELKQKINGLEEEIERYKDELYKLRLLKKALGI